MGWYYDWDKLGEIAGKPAAESGSNPSKDMMPGSNLLETHFQHNFTEISITDSNPPSLDAGPFIQALLDALEKEADTLSGIYHQLQELAGKFHTLGVQSIIKALVGILGEAVLKSVKTVVDALLGMLKQLGASVRQVLDTKLHIPIISDILNALGVDDISFIDLITRIAAAGFTVIYKLARHRAPFEDNETTRAIISASSWESLAALFHPSDDNALISKDVSQNTFQVGHSVAGIVLLIGIFPNALGAGEQADNAFSPPTTVIGLITTAAPAAADVLVPRDAIENLAIRVISSTTTGFTVLAKVVSSSGVQKFAAKHTKIKGMAVNDGRGTGAIVNTVLVLPALAVTGYHFYELNGKAKGSDRDAAIMGEVANLTGYISRVSYAVGVNDEEPDTNTAAIAVMSVANAVMAGLQIAEALMPMNIVEEL